MGHHLVRAVITASATLLASLLVTAPAGAQPSQSGTPSDGTLRITPFMALGDDYAPGGGVAFTLPLNSRLAVEAEGSAGVDAIRTGVSLLVDVARFKKAATYLAVGAGVQRDEVETWESGFGFPSILKKTEFALGIGGGVTIPVGPRWSYRADFRWYDPKAEWPESWRVYSGLTVRLSR